MTDALEFGRVLDLRTKADAKTLREHAQRIPVLHEKLNHSFNDLLRFFPEEGFLRLYSGGRIAVESRGIAFGTDLFQMLHITEKLKSIECYRGIENLLAGFRNPTQFYASCFESEVAAWCAERRITEDIEFSPTVVARGKEKRPEFRWETRLGILFVECKRANLFENEATRKIHRCRTEFDRIYSKFNGWNSDGRVDVTFDRLTGGPIWRTVEELIASCYEAQGCGEFVLVKDGIKVAFGPRGRECPIVRHTIRSMSVEVLQHPTRLDSTNARYTLTMPMLAVRQKALTRLMREARSQLPDDSPGVVFIDILSADALKDKLQLLLSQREYQNTPWTSLWSYGMPQLCVWRERQPFDGRLLD